MAELKQLARRIFQETISAIDTPEAMQRKLRREGMILCLPDAEVDLRAFERIVAAPTGPAPAVAGMKYFLGGHPTPDEQSWKAAEAILGLLKECDEKTIVFFLLSGGDRRWWSCRWIRGRLWRMC